MEHERSAFATSGVVADASAWGIVQLVGAGPGDPELLTLKALRALERADVVVFDRLVSDEILALVPAATRRIDVGKSPRNHPVPQEEINDLLVALAKQGLRVVRLKGGDPFLFGRGGEEVIALASAGVHVEVVPGITSAQGAAARLRMPLTHRTLASSIRLITGHRRADEMLDYDWAGLADPNTTLVAYMALANISEIATELIAHGRDARTPVVAISQATRPGEKFIVGTIATISRDISRQGFEAPVLFVIGEVAAIARFMEREAFCCPAVETIYGQPSPAIAAE